MSILTYRNPNLAERPLIWLHGEVKTPPFSAAARLKSGWLLRRLQVREILSMPHSRPLPELGPRCHELRVHDGDLTWRLIYRLDWDAVVLVEVFCKKTRTTPDSVLTTCRQRLKEYDDD